MKGVERPPPAANLLVGARVRSVPWLKSAVSFGMFYHLEHHLFPRVPTCHLPALAERLDQGVPELPRKRVF